MKSPARNWRLYQLAQACSCRPSDLLGVENTYAAFCLDEAIILYGNALQNELDRVSNNAKTEKAAEGRRQLVLEKWLNSEPGNNKRFASPVATK